VPGRLPIGGKSGRDSGIGGVAACVVAVATRVTEAESRHRWAHAGHLAVPGRGISSALWRDVEDSVVLVRRVSVVAGDACRHIIEQERMTRLVGNIVIRAGSIAADADSADKLVG